MYVRGQLLRCMPKRGQLPLTSGSRTLGQTDGFFFSPLHTSQSRTRVYNPRTEKSGSPTPPFKTRTRVTTLGQTNLPTEKSGSPTHPFKTRTRVTTLGQTEYGQNVPARRILHATGTKAKKRFPT
jgi:hypothetical protein